MSIVLGDGALDDAGAGAEPAGRHEGGKDPLTDPADEVDRRADGDAGGEDDLVAGGVQGDGEAGPVRVGAGDGAGGHRGAEGLAGDQQGVDFLVNACGCSCPQDPAAEDR